MERKNVFCCSCFIDQAVWFIDNSFHSWEFDSFVYKDGLISDKVFVYDKIFVINSNDDNIEYLTTIIVCCLECYEFILRFLSGKEEIIASFNEIDCRYVYEEAFCCFNSVIYVGNDRFQFDARGADNCDCRSTKEKMEKYFVKSPITKSCFTSLAKTYYKYFCYSCRDFFKKTLLKNLYLFTNESNGRQIVNLQIL